MQLAVFGGTGRSGIPLIQQALQKGDTVVALVRTPSKMTIQHERLNVVQGDVMNPGDVDKVVQGADAVLSVIGHVKGSPKDIQTVGIQNILASMNKYGVKRLISLTGAGVAVPQDKPKFINHVISFLLKLLSGDVLADAEHHFEVVQKSPVEWVVVRGPRLTEGPYTGKYRVGWVGVNTGTVISRADLADFMLKQVTDTTYLRQAPMVSD
jgi:putative NADH-flavin reductase